MPKLIPDNLSLEKAREIIYAERDRVRELCKSDLYFLSRRVLGYRELTASFHKPFCELVASSNALIHAQSLKTSDNTGEHQPFNSHNPSHSKDLHNSSSYNQTYVNKDQRASTSDNHAQKPFGGVGGGGKSLGSPTQNPTKFSEHSKNLQDNYDDLSRNNGTRSERDAATYGESYGRLSEIRFRHGVTDERILKYLDWDEEARERLWMIFRGSFKTTIITICHTIQLMLIWPDIRILIQSHKKEGGAQEILGAIKRHFIGNKLFRTLFPEYCPKPNTVGMIEWGTMDRVTLPNRSPTCAWPEATIEIAGANTDVTGRHYDYIKNDDLVTRDSVTNETMIQKTRNIKALQKFLFNQPEWGIMDNVGTFYHFNDIYNTLRKSKGVSKIIVPIVEDDQGPVEDWKPTIPERFSAKGCYALKNDPTMTLMDWSNQYMLNPTPPEDQTFKPEWFERLGFYYEPEDLNDLRLKKYLFVDPANKRNKKADFTAMIVIGIDEDGTKWLLDALRDKLSVEDRTNLAIELCRKHDLKEMYYETQGFQDSDKYIIEQKVRKTGWITVNEIKAGSSNKEDRIKGLSPIFARGDMRWPKTLMYFSKYEKKKVEMIELLRDEFLMFPKGEHDDMIDAMSFLLKVFEMKPSKKAPEQKTDMFAQLQKLAKDQFAKPKFSGFGRSKKRSWPGTIPARKTLW